MSLFTVAIVVVVIVFFVVLVVSAPFVTKERGGQYKDPNRMFPAYVRFETFRRAGERCEYVTWYGRRCSNKAFHADHWIPWSKGGASSEKNCVALCGPCNLAKSNQMPTKHESKRLFKSRSYMVNRMYPGEVYGQVSLDVYDQPYFGYSSHSDQDSITNDSRTNVDSEDSIVDSQSFYENYGDNFKDRRSE